MLSSSISIPRTLNRLIDLKQSVTLTGLGMDRDWTPGHDGQDLTLMFGNCYLTSSCDVGNDVSINMLPIVDPLNILRPLIKNEVHTTDNVVEPDTIYQQLNLHISQTYVEIKPGLLTLTNLVEVQVSFVIIRIARQECVFVPKLHAICLLNCIVETDYNLSAIRVLASRQLSPLKKVKHKVGYWMTSLDESGNDDIHPPPNKQLRGLTLGTTEGDGERKDVSMKDVA
ncbi:hypothetical protein V8D89_005655 [Ganoderma adspersum]